MRSSEITLEEAMKYGEEAKNHAREQIKKGSTQIENNNLSEEYFTNLQTGINRTRRLNREIRKERPAYPIERSPTLVDYESMVTVSSKYSIGNCHELAVQALDYILNHVPAHINAEVYDIDGGDHVFLVLNRDPNSNPQDPKTWGEGAVICDPWANKVYKAKDYLTELENFYRYADENINRTEKFNPAKHTLVQEANFNTHFLRFARTIANLKANFIGEAGQIIKILTNYQSSLKEEEKRLKNKYGADDQKVTIISDKIKLIDHTIRSTRDIVDHLINKRYKGDYRYAKSELLKGVKLINANAINSLQFSAEDHAILSLHTGEDKKTEFMKFFGIRSTTASHLEDIAKEATKQFEKKSNK